VLISIYVYIHNIYLPTSQYLYPIYIYICTCVVRTIFDTNIHKIHKEYSLKFPFGQYDYLRDEMTENMLDRLPVITRTFPRVVEIGCGRGYFLNRLMQLYEPCSNNEKKMEEKKMPPYDLGIQNYTLCDSSKVALDKINVKNWNTRIQIDKKLLSDNEDDELPIEAKSMDLVLGGVYMHWINNLPGFLSNILKILKPDGVFMGAMLGGDTLQELRTSFVLAEQEREGGVSPHVNPMISVRDAGNLLTRAGFSIPTIDNDFLTVYYPDAFTLMNHLQFMGENNALLSRREMISRETLYGAAAIYDSMFRTEKGISATFEIIYMIGWAPDPSQPKPARRGSGEISLKDLAKQFGTTVGVATEE
jgi:NADH dehydrogenase [ubiquinone] 1 alpha subcomplex assembly factor 5